MLFSPDCRPCPGGLPAPERTRWRLCKNRKANLPLQQAVPWYYWMTAHALVHGLTVAVIVGWWTGNKELGAISSESSSSSSTGCIDTLKCEGVTSIHTDQAMHIICKMAWAVMIAKGITFMVT